MCVVTTSNTCGRSCAGRWLACGINRKYCKAVSISVRKNYYQIIMRRSVEVGLGYLTRALAAAPDCAAELRALALHALGELVFYSGNGAAAAASARESLALLRALGDTRHVAESLYLSGTVAW